MLDGRREHVCECVCGVCVCVCERKTIITAVYSFSTDRVSASVEHVLEIEKRDPCPSAFS